MTRLRLIADDLTGALDSGCAFASPEMPILVGLPWQPLPEGPRLAISTDTRDRVADVRLGEHIVAEAVRQLRRGDGPDSLWFKKIDSVLRGNPIGETLAAFHAGSFDHLVFAPAFPEMRRMTQGGQHFLVDEKTGERRPLGPDLVSAFRQHGAEAEVISFDPAHGRGARPRLAAAISIIDAVTQEDLSARAKALAQRIDGRILWAGAGGLAAALSGGAARAAFPPVGALVVGTLHPVTAAQVEHARTSGAVSEIGADDGSESPVLVAPAFASRSAAETRAMLEKHVPAIRIADRTATTIFVVGGDTLSTVLRTVGATSLQCIGEAATGVPVCRILGGRWSGVTLLSKSGGFGSENLITRLIAR